MNNNSETTIENLRHDHNTRWVENLEIMQMERLQRNYPTTYALIQSRPPKCLQ